MGGKADLAHLICAKQVSLLHPLGQLIGLVRVRARLTVTATVAVRVTVAARVTVRVLGLGARG